MQEESVDLLTKKEHYQAIEHQAKRVSTLIDTIQATKSGIIINQEIGTELLDNGFTKLLDYYENNLQPLLVDELERVLEEEEKMLKNLKNHKD